MMRSIGRSAACMHRHTLNKVRKKNVNFFGGQFTIGQRHPNVRVQHVDILRKRLPPSNLHCLSKDDELEMDYTCET